jgi:dienelactone hydrolase
MKTQKSEVAKYCFLISMVLILKISFISNAYSQIVFDDGLNNGNNFDKASFRLWIPDNAKTIQGVIVMMPGSNSDGREMVNDTSWQKIAVRHDFALLGCYYTDKVHPHMEIEAYADVKNGSGQALLDILHEFSVTTRHPELSEVPLALWGMSAGGEFNYEFVCWKPERVIAFIVNKGGVYYSSLAPAAAWEVPGVFITGEKDSPFRNNIIKGIFSINRRFGAKWIFAEEPGTAHEFEKSGEFARFFFDNVIPLRLPADALNEHYTLQKILTKGYIGIIPSGQILPDNINQVDITSWFPNRQIAEGWLGFIK